MDEVGAGRRLSPRGVDVLVTAAVAVPTLMDAWWNEPGSRQADALTYALAGISVLALLARRRSPLGVTLVCGLALTGLTVLGHHGELLNLPVLVALYTVALLGDRHRTVVVAAVAVVWSGVLGVVSADPLGAPGGSPVLELVVPLVPLLLGEVVRSARELDAAAAAELEREAAQRVQAERARMARDLHDVLAHTMAAVSIQMSAATAAFDTRPEVARDALRQAQQTTRTAMAELRTLLHLVRGEQASTPAPGLAQLADLAATARDAGIDARLTCDPPAALPPAVELTAYRVVQEAVTNTIRHSAATRADIAVTASHGLLTIDVRDDGRPPPGGPARGAGSGFGLIGMRERVEAHGGRLDHGPVPGGGFRIHAELPIGGEL